MSDQQKIGELQKENRELTRMLVQSERIRSLGVLSGGVAHHFNNLLSVILGYSSYVLNREELSQESSDALKRISEAAQRGRRLTDELLAFMGSEVESEKVCRVHETLDSVLSLLESQIPSRISIEKRFEARLDGVLSPQSSIHQIVFNLLTNALDSMPSGGRIAVITSNTRMEGEDGEQEFLKIEVDELDESGALKGGSGQDGSRKAAVEDHESVGLKLSSVYGIVGKLEGTVVVSPEPGYLSRVEVFLPVSDGAVASDEQEPGGAESKPSRIWVVDDDQIFREMCRVVLTDEGHDVEEITDGLVVQERWSERNERPDLLIIDFSMPDINGLELCQWLAENENQAPVVLVSGLSAEHPDIHAALKMKKTFFIQKPFSSIELSDVIAMAMGESLIAD